MAIKFNAGNPDSETVIPGDYTLEIIDAKEDTSTNGNDMFKLTTAIVGPDGTARGARIWHNLVITESTAWRINSFLKSCGHHPGEGVDIELDADKMIGWRLRATVGNEVYQGKTSPRIQKFLFSENAKPANTDDEIPF
jgi:hypothetical protein